MINIGKYKIHTHISLHPHSLGALFCTGKKPCAPMTRHWTSNLHHRYTPRYLHSIIHLLVHFFLRCNIQRCTEIEERETGEGREISVSRTMLHNFHSFLSFDACFTSNFTWSSIANTTDRVENENKKTFEKRIWNFHGKVGAFHTYAKCAQKGFTSIKKRAR